MAPSHRTPQQDLCHFMRGCWGHQGSWDGARWCTWTPVCCTCRHWSSIFSTSQIFRHLQLYAESSKCEIDGQELGFLCHFRKQVCWWIPARCSTSSSGRHPLRSLMRGASQCWQQPLSIHCWAFVPIGADITPLGRRIKVAAAATRRHPPPCGTRRRSILPRLPSAATQWRCDAHCSALQPLCSALQLHAVSLQGPAYCFSVRAWALGFV